VVIFCFIPILPREESTGIGHIISQQDQFIGQNGRRRDNKMGASLIILNLGEKQAHK
jgi:hypothetical protein